MVEEKISSIDINLFEHTLKMSENILRASIFEILSQILFLHRFGKIFDHNKENSHPRVAVRNGGVFQRWLLTVRVGYLGVVQTTEIVILLPGNHEGCEVGSVDSEEDDRK